LKSSNRSYSDSQEDRIAKLTGGQVQRNSGGTRFGGGDVHTKYCLIEAKTPTKSQKSFTIEKDWLDKAQEQAFQQGKHIGIVAFRFDTEYKSPNYFILDERTFLQFLEYLERENADGHL